MPFEHLAANDGAIDVALRIDADTFSAGVVAGRRLHVLDERPHGSVLRAADANALLDAGKFVGTGVRPGFGVGDVDRVVAVMKMPLGRPNCRHSVEVACRPGRKSGCDCFHDRRQTGDRASPWRWCAAR